MTCSIIPHNKLVSDIYDSLSARMANSDAEKFSIVIDNELSELLAESAVPISTINIVRRRLYDDLISMVSRESIFVKLTNLKPSTNKLQSVYVIQSDNGFVKVGVSIDTKRRWRGLETQGCMSITNSFCSLPTIDASKVESAVKKQFKRVHIKGEWFNCDFSDMVSFAESLLGQEA